MIHNISYKEAGGRKWTGHNTNVADVGQIYVEGDAGTEKYGVQLYFHVVSWLWLYL